MKSTPPINYHRVTTKVFIKTAAKKSKLKKKPYILNNHLMFFSLEVIWVQNCDSNKHLENFPVCHTSRVTLREKYNGFWRTSGMLIAQVTSVTMYVAKSARSDWNAPTRDSVLSYLSSRAKHNFSQLENYLDACNCYLYSNKKILISGKWSKCL